MAEAINQQSPWYKNNYLWLLALVLLAWWPLTFGAFSIKNDNIVVFLAFRYNISEAILHGHLPLWSPYINLGFPMHADMQSGTWNPVILFLSLFGRYTVTTMHIEILLYIFLAGVGMYKLLLYYRTGSKVAFILAASYMFCGYITDVAGNNIIFLAAAAYLPFVFYYWIKGINNLRIAYAIKSAICLYFLFTSAYPFFVVIAFYTLIVYALVRIIKSIYSKDFDDLKRLLLFSSVTIIVFLLIALPVLLSYFQLLPFYSRGSGIPLGLSQQNSLSFRDLSTVILPQSTLKDGSATDLTMRNAYPGIFSFMFVFLWMFSSGKTKKQWWLFICIIVALLFSLGPVTPFQSFVYHFIPLFDHFRHPANARLLMIIGTILLAGNYVSSTEWNVTFIKDLRRSSFVFATIFLITFLSYLNNITPFIQSLRHTGHLSTDSIKGFLDRLPSGFFIAVNCFIQFAFLGAIIILSPASIKKWFGFLAISNAIILCQLSLPFTSVSRQSPSAINTQLSTYPNGYPLPSINSSILINTANDSVVSVKLGNENYYNKRIGFPVQNYNPTILNSIREIMENPVLLDSIRQLPLAYLSESTATGILIPENNDQQKISCIRMTNNSFTFISSSALPVKICLQQSLLPGWHATVDNRSVILSKANYAFMYAEVPAGYHTIEFYYLPAYLLLSIMIGIITWIIVLYFLWWQPGSKIRSH